MDEQNKHSEEQAIEQTTQAAQAANESACEQELHQTKQRYMYLNAEFDNYKKRIDKERIQWISSGQDMVLVNLLSIVDTVERALGQIQIQQLPQEVVVHLEGFKLLDKELQKILKQYDIIEMSYTQFDPELHEALMKVQSPEHKEGDIVQVLEKGYMRKGILLRLAKVSVAE